MAIIFGSARYDENGGISGGTAGDQTSEEVSTQSYYMHEKGWYCLRPKTVAHATAIAKAMQQACDNSNVGYDQNDRLTLWNLIYGTGVQIEDVATPCECDCSSLNRCCIYQGTGTDVGNITTSTLASKCASSGLFEDKFEVTSESQLYTGDVLVTKTKGHCVIVVSGRDRSSSTSSSSSSTSTSTSVDAAKSYDKSIAGTYTTTSNLNMRSGAGTSKTILTTIPKGDKVTNYGYYTEVSGVKWYYVKYGDLVGFVSSAYLTSGSTSSSSSSTTTTTTSSTSVDSAKSYDKSLAGKYTVVNCSKLNLRAGAGTGKSILTTMSKGDTAQNYGYYTEVDGTKWLYLKYGSYTGFASENYLQK